MTRLLLCWVILLIPTVQGEPGTWLDYREGLRGRLSPRLVGTTLNRQAVSLAMIRKSPADLDARMAVADTLLHLQKYNESAKWYLSVVERDDTRIDAALRFAESLYLAGSPEAALRAISRLDAAGITDPVMPTLVAEVAFKRKAYAICLSRLERAKADLPGKAEADSLLAKYIEANLALLRSMVEPEAP